MRRVETLVEEIRLLFAIAHDEHSSVRKGQSTDRREVR